MGDEVVRLERQLGAFRSANESLAKSREVMRTLVHKLGEAITMVVDEFEDKGDYVCLGSTNHADLLRGIKEAYDQYRWETGDMGDDDDTPEEEDEIAF